MALAARSTSGACCSTSRPLTGLSGRAVIRSFHSSVPARQTRVLAAAAKFDTVADIMTTGAKVFTCRADDSVDKALELLVEHKVAGLPVVDPNNVVIGVVSDFDLLALEAVGKTNSGPMFPTTDETWQAFKAVKTVLAKGTGKKVGEVMTKTPMTVKPTTSLNEATRLLLQKRIRRLPVVDDHGRLVGLISRSSIIRVALELRKSGAAMAL